MFFGEKTKPRRSSVAKSHEVLINSNLDKIKDINNL
jgi:hypothetical protein